MFEKITSQNEAKTDNVKDLKFNQIMIGVNDSVIPAINQELSCSNEQVLHITINCGSPAWNDKAADLIKEHFLWEKERLALLKSKVVKIILAYNNQEEIIYVDKRLTY